MESVKFFIILDTCTSAAELEIVSWRAMFSFFAVTTGRSNATVVRLNQEREQAEEKGKKKKKKRRWIARIIKLLAEKLRDDKKLGIPLGALRSPSFLSLLLLPRCSLPL